MCGVIGAYWSALPLDVESRLDAGIKALRYRGPDDQGYELFQVADGSLALGHTRLSIIDLSPGGHQPMHSTDGRYSVTYNGEIYNYKELKNELIQLGYLFLTESDTEVLLASWITWGKECLPRFKGMFAFALFDHLEGTLTCVRDAFGIKPFYYNLNGNDFVFASELPALLPLMDGLPPLNLQRAYDYLIFGKYDDCADTFFNGIQQLLPGHILTMNLSDTDSVCISRWWWPDIAENTEISFDEAAVKLRSMFLDNIRLHLRSDVSLGAALSGGLDSSAIVCAMRYLEPDMPIHTFTYVARGSAVDEEYWADIINKHVRAIPHKLIVGSKELANDLDDMILAQGEPFGSTSIYAQYRVFKLAKENGMTVTLDGQGADELLAGYNGYPSSTMLSLIEKRKFITLFKFMMSWSQWPGRGFCQAVARLCGEFVPASLMSLALKVVGKNTTPEWMNITFMKENGVQPLKFLATTKKHHGVYGRRLVATLRDGLTGNGLNSLLRHGDRNSMRWSVESRVPFLTIDIAEFLLSLPEHYLISYEGETKSIFRTSMRGIVPDEVLDRRDKVGFETSEQTWLKKLEHEIPDWMTAAETLPFLNSDECRKEVTEMIEGRKPFNSQAWRLINFCRWAQDVGYTLK
jgi:asparagine synthase (glutamine-hydrolysing)